MAAGHSVMLAGGGADFTGLPFGGISTRHRGVLHRIPVDT
jgi:hypothetical protein